MTRNKYNSLIIGLVFFAVAFLISRAQFFACPTVEITNDTGEYMQWIDFYISKGEMPPNNYAPIGYPIIIKALTLIKNSIYTIVYFQIVVTFFSFSTLLLVVWRFYDKTIYYVVVICVALYLQVPNSLYYDISILSESIYNSLLVLLMAALINFIYLADNKNAILLSFALALPVLFRPTGIFTVVVFFLWIAYLVYANRKDVLLRFISPFAFVYIILALYCFMVSGTPNFISKRAGLEFVKKSNTDSVIEKGSASNLIKDSVTFKFAELTKFGKTIVQYNNYTYQSQMYTKIEEANKKYFVRDFPHTNEWQCCYFEEIDSAKTKERKTIFKEFYDTGKMKYLVEVEAAVKQSKWFKLYDVFQNLIIKKIVLNSFWILLMFGSFVFACCIFLLSKFTNSKALLLIFIITINLGTMGAVIAASHNPLPRYSYPAEFIFLLQLPFLIDLLRERINAFK